jgi:peptidoglycan/xylan/chitin deacetylase (PgdA/CDA1 family)
MRRRAAVFCLHDIVRDEHLADVAATHRPYALAPAEFRAHLMLAHEVGLRTAVVGQIPQELGDPFFSLTFDDGCLSDYTEALPALRELGMRATFFVVPTLVGAPGHVSWAQLREMAAAGMEIGSHSLTHPFLHELDAAGLRHEFGQSKAILEERLGSAVRSASLPRGWEPPGLEAVLDDLGYRAFCNSRVGWWHPGDRPLAIPRVAVRRGMVSDDFIAIATAAPRALWRLTAVDVAKNVAKACLGHGGWQRLRAPLLALRERM